MSTLKKMGFYREQFGFRKNHSTLHQLKRIVNLNNTTIWHYGLIYKLKRFGYPVYLQKLIKSFLYDRLFVVSIDNILSNERKIQAGVPQGSVFSSPTLCSIYISDFKLRKNNTTALYEDDTALIILGKVSKKKLN